jgi:uncharacterized protein (TIGR02145 family)
MKPLKLLNLSIVAAWLLFTAGVCNKDDSPVAPPDNGTVTDIDGNVYKTVKIGTQVWMSENLKTTKYRNGQSVNLVVAEKDWTDLIVSKQPARTYSEFKSANVALFGMLYNWQAVNDSRGLAPAGWHIPSDAEWTQLIDFLGGKNTTTGNKMKSTTSWNPPSNGNNSSGFSALAGGAISFDGKFSPSQNIGNFTTWWSATSTNDPVNPSAYVRRILSDGLITATASWHNYGFSVRCVKD